MSLWDTSALLKLYVRERDSDRFLKLVRESVPIRALDGLLLASARIARTSDLISVDLRMRAAGVLLGLRVLPND